MKLEFINEFSNFFNELMKNRETWLQKRPCAQFPKEIITKKEKIEC